MPKFFAVAEQIEKLIDGAEPGTPLPTERELATRFETSRTTIRQALASLVLDGRLERTQGSGTYVAEPKLVQVRQLTSYSDDLRRQGRDPASTVLDIRRVPADATVAARLAVRPGEPVVRVERIRGVGDEPLAHEVAHLRGPLPRLRQELTRHGSLYAALRETYGIRLARVEDQVQTVLAGPREAGLLGVDVGLPMLLIHRTGWDRDGVPVEYTRSVFRGDRFSFIAESTVGET